jgi:hypothetical protein
MMADAYGGISLSASKDSLIDAEQLVDLLNQYSWTNANGEWIKNEINGKDTFWHIDDFNTQYPTVFPTKLTLLIKEEDESIRRIPEEEATDEDHDRCWDFDSEIISLSTLSKNLSKAIKKGWFEIACTANEKNRYVYFQSLRIHSNGRAIRKQLMSGC